MSKWIAVGDHPNQLMRERGKVLVSIDTETTGLDYPDDVIGISMAWGCGQDMKSCYITAPVGQVAMDLALESVGEVEPGSMLPEIYKRFPVVFHNEPFDMRSLNKVQPGVPNSSHDIMHLASLAEHQPSRELTNLYLRYIDRPIPPVVLNLKNKRGQLSKLPLHQVAEYSRFDATSTLELFYPLYKKAVTEPGQQTLYNGDREYARLVMRLIQTGIRLDFTWCQRREAQYRKRIVEIQDHLRSMGLKNPGSNAALANFLFNQMKLPYTKVTAVQTRGWKNGVPSVDVDVLEGLAPHNEVVSLVLEHRQLSSAISKWLLDYRHHAKVDGKIHSILDPFGTVSGRMAASNPNVMALPMEDREKAFGTVLGIFRATEPGHRLWAIDYSQAEVRIAAAIAREKNMLALLNSKEDPYILMAIKVWNDGTKRPTAKRVTLASIYELGAHKFSEKYKVPYEEADQHLKDFRRNFPGMKRMSNLCAILVRQDGCIRDYTGRPRWFGPDDEDYKAFNQRVQMTVADIMKEAMLRVSKAYPGMLLLQVHDSVPMQIPIKGQAAIIKDVQRILTESVPEEYRVMVEFPTDKKPWQ